jgi:hypothetical protein
MVAFFKRRYGASPLHVVGHLAVFGIAAFALAQIVNGGAWINFVVWFGGAALLHDIVFLPFYSLLDRFQLSFHRRLPDRRVPIINHIRAPALISGMLLLVYFPLILGAAGPEYHKATGHHLQGYLRNWLLITAVLFLGSAVVYGVRVWRGRAA